MIGRNSDAQVFLARFEFLSFNNSWLFILVLCNLWHYPWPSLPLFFTSLNFFKVEHFGCYRCCNKIFVTFANFAKLADHKRSLFTYIMLLLNLLFLRHLLACFFLIQSFHIARKSIVIFAIFAKFADFSKPFFTSSLSKCRLFNS